jgi:hypothetical protein
MFVTDCFEVSDEAEKFNNSITKERKKNKYFFAS